MNRQPAQLLCIGNAMIDVYAEVPADFYKRFELTSPAEHVSAEAAAAILAALPPGKIITSGGSAANTAKIAALLGVPSAFAGAIGSTDNGPDPFAALFKKELDRAGVSLYLARKKFPTGVFISLRTKNAAYPFQRTIAASPSAALELDAEDIDEAMFADKTARVLMLDGFLLGRKKLLQRILELAKKYLLVLALDPGAPGIAAEQAKLIHRGNSPFWDKKLHSGAFPLLLFLNEKEAETFAQTLGSAWKSMFLAASRNDSFLAAVKLAERGAAVFSGGRHYRAPAEPVEAAESTGAGDAFAAGFLTAWIRGEGPEQCGLEGNTAAALVLQAPGTSIETPPAGYRL
ncbi:MAG: PfkB family carbohydrate kinase [Treponema sp.]|nr:PfkB family carbohydrate kinase [Treponema sp.]